MRRFMLALSTAALLLGCGRKAPDPAHLGSATMQPDGTIVLRMRPGVPGYRAQGQGVVAIAPNDPHYPAVLENVGPIEPGQTVSIRRWVVRGAAPEAGPHEHRRLKPETIGWATLRDDGALVLEVDAEHLEEGGEGVRVFTFPRGHPEYQAILRQLPAVKPGERVTVPAWLKLETPRAAK